MSVRRSARGEGLIPLAFIFASRKESIGLASQPGLETRGAGERRGGWKAQKLRSSGVIGRSISFADSSFFFAASFSNPSNEALASIQRRSVSIAASGSFLPGGIVGLA